MTFFRELKRRNVFRVGTAYALAAWVLLQIADFTLEVIDAPSWILQVFVLAAAIGLPIVLIVSWVFEMTPEGLKRESQIDRSHSITPQTGRKLDRVIIVFLALAVATLLLDRFLLTEAPVREPAASSAVEAGPPPAAPPSTPHSAKLSVAVLPFLALSNGPDDGYFADGLTEEILNALAQLPELLVTARTSAFSFKGQDLPVQEIASTLGVAHIVEGSVRRAGERLRVTAQLIRAADGFHLWSENYDSTEEDTIAVQQDIAEKIALAMDVVMNEDKREAMRRAGLRDVEAFIALQKGLELADKAHGDPDIIGTLRQANRYFEIVQERVPDYAPAYAEHSDVYVHMLLNDATGEWNGDATPQEVASALDRATADFQAVVANARTPQERNNAELDLAFITSNWRGLPARIERFAGEQGCSDSAWIQITAVSFGYATKMNERLTAIRKCDPLSSSTWRNEARALLWSGNAEGALAIAHRGLEVSPNQWLQMQLVTALIAIGEFESANHEISISIPDREVALPMRMMAAAASGDRAKAASLFDEYNTDPLASAFWKLAYYAWTGDLENANRTAAGIDPHPFSGPGLATALMWCTCGAPWDLAATPHFAGLIEDAGFDWPPVSPIRFPLKD
jgi:TolB-like protein